MYFFELAKELVYAFLATITFAVVFNTPKKELLYCGIVGAVGWLFYSISLENGGSSSLNNFIGTFFVAYLSKILARVRKNPISVFLTTGIITLVPGANIYNMVLNIIMTNNDLANFYALEVINIACAIALGIIVALALPNFYNIKIDKK